MSPAAHSYLGFTLAVQEKFPEAEKELRRAVGARASAHPYALPNLAHTLFVAGKAAEAVPVLSEGRRSRPRGRHERRPRGHRLRPGPGSRGGWRTRNEAERIAADTLAALSKEIEAGRRAAPDLYGLLGKLSAIAERPGEARTYLDKALAGR